MNGCKINVVWITLITAILAPTAGNAQQEVYPIPDIHGAFTRNAQSDAPEVGLIIGGEFARVMFNLMTSPAIKDPCGEGIAKKDQSMLHCYQDIDGAAQCSFGYDFKRQTLTSGPLVC